MFMCAFKAPQGRLAQSYDLASPGWCLCEIDDWLQRVLLRRSWKGYMCYNDEPPFGLIRFSGGHCKGILLWDDEKLGWLIHSVPRYPRTVIPLSKIEPPQCVYGQNFAYLEVDKIYEDSVMSQISHMRAHIYIIKDLYRKLPPATDETVKRIDLPGNHMHLSKNPNHHVEMYQDVLAMSLGGNWYAETWGRPLLPDSDNVSNVHAVIWKNGTEYKEGSDHSKWALDKVRTYCAFGDLNRMTDQKFRGGGALVIPNEDLVCSIRAMIHAQITSCLIANHMIS